MNARAWTSLLVSGSLIAFVVFMLIFGRGWLNLDQEGQLSRLLAAAAQSPFAVIGVVSIFSLLALTGFPQILLITATVIVFGARAGAAYSWIATMASATLTFFLGHMLGGAWVLKAGGQRTERLIGFLQRRGALASALIRVVPSAPFIVVNAAAGAAHIPIWKYWLGTGAGIIPKIAIVASLGAITPDAEALRSGVDGVVEFFTRRNPRDFAIVAAVVAGWLGFLAAMRVLYRRLRARGEAYD